MAKVYRTRCVVKRNGVNYKRGSIIEDLSAEEIRKGLANYWLEEAGEKSTEAEIEEAEAGAQAEKPKGGKKKPGAKAEEEAAAEARNALIEKAMELNIDVTEDMTDEVIQQLIEEAEAGAQQ